MQAEGGREEKGRKRVRMGANVQMDKSQRKQKRKEKRKRRISKEVKKKNTERGSG